MEINQQRRWLMMASGAMGLAWLASGATAKAEERVIKIVAKKFDFTPNEIQLTKGMPVVLELTTLDVFMGINAPGLGIRTDIVPGKTVRVNLTPDKAGTFPFICDVFCGDGHEEMGGQFIVS
jgi:cytochrome c oxidase subunit II